MKTECAVHLIMFIPNETLMRKGNVNAATFENEGRTMIHDVSAARVKKMCDNFWLTFLGREFRSRLVTGSVIKIKIARHSVVEERIGTSELNVGEARFRSKKEFQGALGGCWNCLWIDWRRNVTFARKRVQGTSLSKFERSNFAFDTFTNIFAPRALCVCIPSSANGRAACIMRGIWFRW